MKRAETLVSAALLAALCIAYGIWAFTTTALNVASAAASAVVCALFGWACLRCTELVFGAWQREDDPDPLAGLGKRSLRPGVRHPVIGICLTLLASRLVVYILAYALLVAQKGYQGGLLDTLSIWLKGDAPHYLGIAENWYATQGDPRFHIVFFPLYPIAVRLSNVLFGSYFASGLFVSNLAAVGAGYLLYELALMDMDRQSAKRAVKFQFLMPAAFLLCAPMSDSLFLLLSAAALLLMRKRHYASACLMAGLASFCRVQGVLLMAPILVELVTDTIRARRAGENGRAFVWRQVRRYAGLLLAPLGLGLYIWINYTVTGNPLQFLVYQSEHWSQRMGWFFNTAAYQTNELVIALGNSERALALGLWLPNLLALLLALILLLPAIRVKTAQDPERVDESGSSLFPMRASYVVYLLVYYFFSMGATWLLSAPRYLLCAVPFALVLARITRRRWVNVLLTLLFAALQVGYLAMYVAGGPVY